MSLQGQSLANAVRRFGVYKHVDRVLVSCLFQLFPKFSVRSRERAQARERVYCLFSTVSSSMYRVTRYRNASSAEIGSAGLLWCYDELQRTLLGLAQRFRPFGPTYW